jgi:hypothetical protein
MDPKISRLEAGFLTRRPQQAFVEEARRILLEPRPPSKDSSTDSERKRFAEFIAMTGAYLDLLGGEQKLMDKLAKYHVALRDLDRGVTAPYLASKKLSNAAPSSTETWRWRAMLAVALDYLVRVGIHSMAQIYMFARAVTESASPAAVTLSRDTIIVGA